VNLSIYAINYTKEGMSQVYDTPSLSFIYLLCEGLNYTIAF
jgi:hypothetical protein